MTRQGCFLFITFGEGLHGPPELFYTIDAIRAIECRESNAPSIVWLRCYASPADPSRFSDSLARKGVRTVHIKTRRGGAQEDEEISGSDCFQEMLIHIEETMAAEDVRAVHCFGLEAGTRLGIIAARLHELAVTTHFSGYLLQQGLKKNRYTAAWCLENTDIAVATSIRGYEEAKQVCRHRVKDMRLAWSPPSASSAPHVGRLILVDSSHGFDRDEVQVATMSAGKARVLDLGISAPNTENISGFVTDQLCVLGHLDFPETLLQTADGEALVRYGTAPAGFNEKSAPYQSGMSDNETEAALNAYAADNGVPRFSAEAWA